MTATQSLKIFQILQTHFKNADDATKVVEAIEAVVNEKVTAQTEIFEKIVTKDIDTLRQDIDKSLATKQDLAETKADVIKWMFLFWIGSTVATLGGLIAIVRFMIVR